MNRRIWNGVWILLGILTLLALSCENDGNDTSGGKSRSSASDTRTDGRDPAKPDDGASAEPPPLLEEEDSGPTLDELLQQVEEARRKSMKARKPENDKGNILYQWTDESGVLHTTSDYFAIPDRYRDEAKSIPMEHPGGSAPPGFDPNQDYDPQPFREDRQKQEAVWRDWQNRVQAVRRALENAKAEKTRLEAHPPECQADMIPGMSAKFDPECTKRYKEALQAAENGVRRAAGEVDRMLEAARRAGVPPGYLR